MDIRHTIVKSFDNEMETRKYVLAENIPFPLPYLDGEPDALVSNVAVSTNEKGTLTVQDRVEQGKQKTIATLGETGKQGVLPLSQMFDHTPELGKELDKLTKIALEMYPAINPNTGVADVTSTYPYAKYIPLVITTGAMTSQTEGDTEYFNPEGSVSVAEFLDGLNAINYGCNANNKRRKTLDNISNVSDYFNEGYQAVCRGFSSPMFNLYLRSELIKPITRVELAYLTVICWERFIQHFTCRYGGVYYLGVNFDWENPYEYASKYHDLESVNISQIILDSDSDVTSLNIQDYKGRNRTMTEYKKALEEGVSPLPLPLAMSMIELGVLGLFPFTQGELCPMKEVTRGEFAYFLTKLAEIFPSKYINNEEVVAG